MTTKPPRCSAIAPSGFKCARLGGHEGYHYCGGVPKWQGDTPQAREGRFEAAPIYQLTGEDLKEWRLRLGVSAVDIERRLGVSRSGQMWGRWESGAFKPPTLLSYIAYWLPELPDPRDA